MPASSPDENQTVSTASEATDAIVYFVGAISQRIGLFLLLPVLVHRLTVSEYGAFGLAQSGLTLLPAVLTLNIPATMTRLYFDQRTGFDKKAAARKLSLMCLLIGAATAFLGIFFGTRADRLVAQALGLPQAAALTCLVLVVLGALGSAQLQMAYAIWRAEHRPILAVGGNVLGTALFLATALILTIKDRLTVVSAIACYSLSFLIVGLGAWAAANTWRPVTQGPQARKLLQDALRYGIPMLPYLLGMWTLVAGGRWIARGVLSLEDTGYFTLASQIALVVSLTGRAAYDAWAPRSFALFAAGRPHDARRYLRSRSLVTLGASVLLGVVVTAGFRLLIPFFAPSYVTAAAILPLMIVAPFFEVAYLECHTELLGLKHTAPVARTMLFTIPAFLVLGSLGARVFGLWGLTTAYVVVYILQWLLARGAVRLTRRTPDWGGATE